MHQLQPCCNSAAFWMLPIVLQQTQLLNGAVQAVFMKWKTSSLFRQIKKHEEFCETGGIQTRSSFKQFSCSGKHLSSLFQKNIRRSFVKLGGYRQGALLQFRCHDGAFCGGPLHVGHPNVLGGDSSLHSATMVVLISVKKGGPEERRAWAFCAVSESFREASLEDGCVVWPSGAARE